MLCVVFAHCWPNNHAIIVHDNSNKTGKIIEWFNIVIVNATVNQSTWGTSVHCLNNEKSCIDIVFGNECMFCDTFDFQIYPQETLATCATGWSIEIWLLQFIFRAQVWKFAYFVHYYTYIFKKRTSKCILEILWFMLQYFSSRWQNW